VVRSGIHGAAGGTGLVRTSGWRDDHRGRHRPGMKKRILAVFLWFYAGWYCGAILASFFGISPMLGPIIGAAAAALIAGDPRGIIWNRRAPAAGLQEAPAAGLEELPTVELPRAA
jgi:hypothetical protein